MEEQDGVNQKEMNTEHILLNHLLILHQLLKIFCQKIKKYIAKIACMILVKKSIT